MAVGERVRLDALDAAILSALSADARRSLREVAERVGSTPTTVSARLERLRTAGVWEGATLRLDPGHLPGTSRLIIGQVPGDRTEAVLEAARRTKGVAEAAVAADGRLVVILQVRGLEDEEAAVAALASAGARDLSATGVRRALGPAPVHLFDAPATIAEDCAVCGRDVGPDPVVETVDGRRVPFCCPSCRGVYVERYERLRAGADR